ncbi:MAG: hypothetical protein HN790_13730 [Methylococcales bacterium]|nr:hypothetical protein [Methylococcales bacterium]
MQQGKHTQQKHFVLSIPIADRPEHLRGSLESIYQICHLYGYGGKTQGTFKKVTVIIVEDSKEQCHIDADISLAQEYTKKGLTVHHYGLDEQYQLMLKLPEAVRKQVSSIIGEPSVDKFYHKGQAVTRNLSHLKLLQLSEQNKAFNKDHALYYFVDSDQQFRVNRVTEHGDEFVYALNYFHTINQIFNDNDIAMLTGKLVCDPPVSPSVMAANFLDDVTAFLQQISQKNHTTPCEFHPKQKIKPDDAAYHDMAQLFGLKSQHKTYDYCCTLKEKHDNAACFNTFSSRINHFFFGEHLTRKTYFTYQSPQNAIIPARTIYPGNYITTFEGLKYIIPFGQLRLRMSGPTAGRLIQSEIGQRFASVNLPMLHARTLQSDFKDEYRPGVEDNIEHIDLGDEFERQYFGDLMLFTVDRLAKSGINIEQYDEPTLSEMLSVIELELLNLYETKHHNVIHKNAEFIKAVNNSQAWWNTDNNSKEAVQQLQQFASNIQHNFNEQALAYQQIQSASHREKRIATILDALLHYQQDREAWDAMLLHPSHAQALPS